MTKRSSGGVLSQQNIYVLEYIYVRVVLETACRKYSLSAATIHTVVEEQHRRTLYLAGTANKAKKQHDFFSLVGTPF